MSVFNFQWYKAPQDRRVIQKWLPSGSSFDPLLELPTLPDCERWTFLALGDTGDAPFPDARISPLYAVAQRIAAELRLAAGNGTADLLLHLGDVVYYAGEERLYDAYLREPFKELFSNGSGDRPFVVPFLPVPGNHDYYDLSWWVVFVVRLLRQFGLHETLCRTLKRNLPLGGSGAGSAFGKAFIHSFGTEPPGPLRYEPGRRTRIPHRYYRFRSGAVDFFALDSNTLDAPSHPKAQEEARRHAAERLADLRERRTRLGGELKASAQKGGEAAHRCLEAWLDIQRDIARLENRRRMTADDHDVEQLAWLRRSLEESERLHPDGWRVVYLHHPLFTTTTSHCEESAVTGVRENLLQLLRGRVHLVLSGHSHAFEWIRSPALPGTGLIVSGGGGISLGSSVLAPGEQANYPELVGRLRRSGAEECAFGGSGAGDLHHYVSVEVTPDTLTVRPVGIAPDADGRPEITAPMPVCHVPSIPAYSGEWKSERRLVGVAICRGVEPRALWQDHAGH